MTLKYFKRLSEGKQYRRLLLKGICVGERTTEDLQLLLFQIDMFYVEVAFHKETDEVLSCRSFACGDELQPYLDQIDLSGLF